MARRRIACNFLRLRLERGVREGRRVGDLASFLAGRRRRHARGIDRLGLHVCRVVRAGPRRRAGAVIICPGVGRGSVGVARRIDSDLLTAQFFAADGAVNDAVVTARFRAGRCNFVLCHRRTGHMITADDLDGLDKETNFSPAAGTGGSLERSIVTGQIVIGTNRQFSASIRDRTTITGDPRQISAAFITKVMAIAGRHILIAAGILPNHIGIIGFDIVRGSGCDIQRNAAGITSLGAGDVFDGIYRTIVFGDSDDILFAILKLVSLDEAFHHGDRGIDHGRLIRIVFRTDREQVQRAGCGACLISKELVAACC